MFKMFEEAYKSIPKEIIAPGGHKIPNAAKVFKGRMSQMLGLMPGGKDLVKSIAKLTTAYAKSGKEEDMYRYNGKFEPNDAVIGTWHWAIWPRPKTEKDLAKLAETWAKNKKGGKPKQTLQILPNGSVKSRSFRNYFWSGDMLIGINDGIARVMKVKKFGGKDFMLLEVAGFEKSDKPIPWNKQYTFFMKVK